MTTTVTLAVPKALVFAVKVRLPAVSSPGGSSNRLLLSLVMSITKTSSFGAVPSSLSICEKSFEYQRQ